MGKSLLGVLCGVLIVAGALARTRGCLSAGLRRSIVVSFPSSFAARLPAA
jgi:hypothetical protein